MIRAAQRDDILERAYVPEHLPDYVTAITGAEPFLAGDYLLYLDGERLVFIGYALQGGVDEPGLDAALKGAMARFMPTVVSVIAAARPAALPGSQLSPPDAYYRLDLRSLQPSKKLRNMLKRAGSELSVEMGQAFTRQHKKLVDDFVRQRRLDWSTRAIFHNLPAYLKSPGAWIFSARDRRGELAAFDVVDFSARHYAFYLFNFRSRKRHVPGASDLLLDSAIQRARAEGKHSLNLGLGLNPGVTFFKTKWGGVPFLPYQACLHEAEREDTWGEMLGKL
ncbi:MAG: translation initiation factor IF-2 [Chloroflexota bacterium]